MGYCDVVLCRGTGMRLGNVPGPLDCPPDGMATDHRKIDEAVEKARGGHYQLACSAAFEGVHRVPEMDVGVSTPLQYYAGGCTLCGAGGSETRGSRVQGSWGRV